MSAAKATKVAKKKPTMVDPPPVPPATCPFSEVADSEGVVHLRLPIGAPDGSVVTAINIKITDPNGPDEHTADFTVCTSSMTLHDLLFRSGASPFIGGGALAPGNIKDCATADDCVYIDNCACVIPLDPPCDYDPSVGRPFKLSKMLKGGVFRVVATLSDYEPEQRVEGTIVLVRDSSSDS